MISRSSLSDRRPEWAFFESALQAGVANSVVVGGCPGHTSGEIVASAQRGVAASSGAPQNINIDANTVCVYLSPVYDDH